MDENEFMMDFTRIDDILAIHEDIYHVSIIDPQGNVVASKLKKTGNTKTREELFGIDLCIIRQIFDLGNDIHGRTYCVIIRRENKQHVVHFLDNFQRCHNFSLYHLLFNTKF
ncbi:MAG: hypothetical protein KGI07_10255 [Thaumarchaeota archaeon]|nr:hypothetical protein [Nitrososphaerota archaeon]